MYCKECGTKLKDNMCPSCQENNLIGFSDKINDPIFDKYLKNTARYGKIFAVVLSFILIVGFFIYGELHPEMDNPAAVTIGIIVAGLYTTLIFLFTGKRSTGVSWDGFVIDKKKKVVQKNVKGEGPRRYTEYKILFESDQGKKHERIDENTTKVYDYYEVGDRVRFHGKLGTFEKYDKSGDTYIFCNACMTVNEISNNKCFRCNCPLLK